MAQLRLGPFERGNVRHGPDHAVRRGRPCIDLHPVAARDRHLEPIRGSARCMVQKALAKARGRLRSVIGTHHGGDEGDCLGIGGLTGNQDIPGQGKQRREALVAQNQAPVPAEDGQALLHMEEGVLQAGKPRFGQPGRPFRTLGRLIALRCLRPGPG